MKTYRAIQVGTGGFGGWWCRDFLPPFIESGRLEVVAAVDVNADALQNAKDGLGLTPERCYTDLAKALDDHEADVCIVVVPPAHHEDVVDAALDCELDILSEKPIADTLLASVRINDKVTKATRKMAITMSHRFDQDKTTFRDEVRAEHNGRLDYLVGRFTSANRELNSWGVFRHQIADPLLVEGAIHHLDILVDLAGAPCSSVSASTWNPAWGRYQGDSEGFVLLEFENGVRAVYEGATCSATGLNGWGQENVRAECEQSTIVLDRRSVTRYAPDGSRPGEPRAGEEIPLLEHPQWRHQKIIADFLTWMDGGPPPPTNVSANLHSTAVMFAAVESSRRRQVIDVADLVAETRAKL